MATIASIVSGLLVTSGQNQQAIPATLAMTIANEDIHMQNNRRHLAFPKHPDTLSICRTRFFDEHPNSIGMIMKLAWQRYMSVKQLR